MSRPKWPHKVSAGDYHKKKMLWDISSICGICDKPLKDIESATVDHIIPRSRGGLSNLSNLQLAHYDCNTAKRSDLPKGLEYLEAHDDLSKIVYPNFRKERLSWDRPKRRTQ